jgi:hypothetical protein
MQIEEKKSYFDNALVQRKIQKKEFLGFDNEEDDAERLVVKIDDVLFLFYFL